MLAFVGWCALAAGGCSNTRYRVPQILRSDGEFEKLTMPKFVDAPDSGADSNSSSRIEIMNPYTYNPSRAGVTDTNQRGTPLYEIASSYSGNDGASRRYEARNQLQNAILRLSDQAMSNHLARLKASESFWNNSLGFATLALAAGSAATTGGVATGLAAGATVTSGTRSLINEQEFRNALVESIILLIEKDRQKKLEDIRQSQSLPILKYDVEQAIADAIDYHQRGSFYHGLALLAEAARKSGNELEQSTASMLRAKAEVAKLMGLDDGLENLTKFIGKAADSKTSDGEAAQEWLKNANAEQVAAALAYLRAAYKADPNEKKIKEQEGVVQSAQTAVGKADAEFMQALTELTMAKRTAERAEDAVRRAEDRLEQARSFDRFAVTGLPRIANSLEWVKGELAKLDDVPANEESRSALKSQQADLELQLESTKKDAQRAAEDIKELLESLPGLRKAAEAAREASDMKEQTVNSADAVLTAALQTLKEARVALEALRKPAEPAKPDTGAPK